MQPAWNRSKWLCGKADHLWRDTGPEFKAGWSWENSVLLDTQFCFCKMGMAYYCSERWCCLECDRNSCSNGFKKRRLTQIFENIETRAGFYPSHFWELKNLISSVQFSLCLGFAPPLYQLHTQADQLQMGGRMVAGSSWLLYFLMNIRTPLSSHLNPGPASCVHP